MRPVRLAIEGLACFKDKQEIDFAELELFAICGPTGAGKSTLLDAMIFALYGEVPRVDSRNRTEMIAATRDRATVMLDFDVGADHYRITRTLQRSGGVNKVRLERRDEATAAWKSVTAQVREATDAVARILGLDASAFMQAVVLPQGEFARFLKAPPKDRREMLCTLLGLAVYERMREQAQQRAGERKGQVESYRKLLAEYEGGGGGGGGEGGVAELEAAHAQIAGGLDGARAERDAAQVALAGLRGRHEQTRQLREAEVRQRRLQEQAEEVSRAGERLAAAERAAALRALLDDVTRAAGEADRAAQAAAGAGARCGAARAAHEQSDAAQRAATEAAEAIGSIRDRIDRLNRVIGQLPARDELRAAVARQAEELAALGAELAALEARAQAAQAAQAVQAAAIEAARRDAEAAGYDAALDGVLAGVRDRAVQLGAARAAAREAATDAALAREKTERLAEQVRAQDHEARVLEQVAEEVRGAARAAEEELDRAQRQDAANHLRACLGPGQPCPVCEQIVAVPPVAGASPALEALASALERALAQAREAEELARRSAAQVAAEHARLDAERQRLSELQARGARLAAEVAAGEAELRQALGAHAPRAGASDDAAGKGPEKAVEKAAEKAAEKAVEKAVEKAAGKAAGKGSSKAAGKGSSKAAGKGSGKAASKAVAVEAAVEVSIEVPIEAWIVARVAALAKSRRVYEDAQARLAGAQRLGDEARTEELLARGKLEDRQATQRRLDADRAADGRRLAAIEAELAAVAGAADPAAEVAAAAAQIQRLEQAVRAADTASAATRDALAIAQEALRLTAQAATAAAAAAADAAARRDAEIARAGFEDEPAVRAALLEPAAAEQLGARVRAHAQELHSAGDRIAALEAELAGARVSDAELAAVEQRAAELTTRVERAVGEETRLREQLARARERRERSRELRVKLEVEERALRLYGQLAGDLRSDRFQAYVLAEALAEIVRGASARLRMLTGQRYSLHFDAKEDEIVVVDHDNAGETRISDTLSGGETFLASLALALELSDQVQRAAGAVRLDSLFIDEGFGTLDPDTLEDVVEAIHGLRVGGRMVGIITHIPELKEAFEQQVIVTKHPGFSTVKVHGVMRRPAPAPAPRA